MLLPFPYARYHSHGEGIGRVEVGHPSRQLQLVPHIVKPNDCAISREKERNAKSAKIEGTVAYALCVPLGLLQHALWPK